MDLSNYTRCRHCSGMKHIDRECGCQKSSRSPGCYDSDTKFRLDIADAKNIDITRAAARLANALRDINNDIGETPEVKSVVAAVMSDIDEYAGLENYGES